jgi:hypothetical protein
MLDQPAFNRDRLKAEKLIDSKVLEQLIRVQTDTGCSSALIGAQRAATDNKRMTRRNVALCAFAQQGMARSMGLPSDDYVNLPKRCVDAQTNFVEQTFDR